MTKYNIHIDKPLPDPGKLAKHKDFDSLYQQYQVTTRFDFWRNLYRKPTFFAGLVAMIAIIFLISEYNTPSPDSPGIQPPLPTFQPAYQAWTLSAEEGISLSIQENLQVEIPANAFQKENGEPVSGELQLRLRELQHPAEVFLSGVPMWQDSIQLDPLLLFEVQAWQGDQALGLQLPLKAIYQNCQAGEPYQLASLNASEQAWDWSGEIQTVAETLPPDPERIGPKPLRPELLVMADEEELTPKAMGSLPQRPGRPFAVKVKNLRDYPQFRGYERVYWEYLEAPNSANPWEEGLIGKGQGWEDVRITPLGNRSAFSLKFSRQTAGGLAFRTVLARPMFEARSQEEADQMYQERYQSYAAAVAARQADLARTNAAEREQIQALQQYESDLAAWEMARQDSVRTCAKHFAITRLGYVGLSQTLPLTQKTISIPLLEQGEISLLENSEGMAIYLAETAQLGLQQIPLVENMLQLPELSAPARLWLVHPEHGVWAATVDANSQEASFEALPEFADPILWLEGQKLPIDNHLN